MGIRLRFRQRLNSSYSSKSTEAKQLARLRIEQNLPPKQMRRPLSLLLSPSFFYAVQYTLNSILQNCRHVLMQIWTGINDLLCIQYNFVVRTCSIQFQTETVFCRNVDIVLVPSCPGRMTTFVCRVLCTTEGWIVESRLVNADFCNLNLCHGDAELRFFAPVFCLHV